MKTKVKANANRTYNEETAKAHQQISELIEQILVALTGSPLPAIAHAAQFELERFRN